MPPAAVTVAISQTRGSGRASRPGAAKGLTGRDESGSGALGERQRPELVAAVALVALVALVASDVVVVIVADGADGD
jgi:hypothetical protein